MMSSPPATPRVVLTAPMATPAKAATMPSAIRPSGRPAEVHGVTRLDDEEEPD
jgi:hypothetical protein